MNKTLTAPFVLLLLIVCTALSFTIGRSTSRVDEFDVYRDSIRAYAEQVDDLVKYTNELSDVADEFQEEITNLREENTTLKSRVDTTTKKLVKQSIVVDSLKKIVDTIPNIPPPVVEYITSLEDKIDDMSDVIEIQSTVIFNLEKSVELTTIQRDIHITRADSLTQLIQEVPLNVPNPNKIFGVVPKPTRVQSFLLGSLVSMTILVITNG